VADRLLSWRCWDRGDGRYAMAAETMERDPETREFYGACVAISKASFEEADLWFAIARLKEAFRADIRFESNRDAGLSWYRSGTGWR